MDVDKENAQLLVPKPIGTPKSRDVKPRFFPLPDGWLG
jgi:hypothetical protein